MTDVFITKYALTSGILRRELDHETENMAVVIEPGGINNRAYYHGNDWHRRYDLAVARAEKMRVSKIASLKKQITKLENMKFDLQRI